MVSKEFVVDNMGVWIDGAWCWKLMPRVEVLGREVLVELDELKVMLTGILPRVNHQDHFVWPFDSSKCLTVSSCYKILNAHRGAEGLAKGVIMGLASVWKAYVPSKLKIFG